MTRDQKLVSHLAEVAGSTRLTPAQRSTVRAAVVRLHTLFQQRRHQPPIGWRPLPVTRRRR